MADIIETAMDEGSLETLITALQIVDLIDVLQDSGPFASVSQHTISSLP